MQPGEEITVRVDELVAGGDALARIDGLPVFTPNLFPGDLAVVRLTEAKKGFARGEVIRLIEPSALRRSNPCPVAGECGGCDWTALRLDAQLAAKKRILTESLRRIGKFDVASLPPINIHASPLNYRIRSRLHREGGATGFYAMRTNRVVQLPVACEVVGPETAREYGQATSGAAPSGLSFRAGEAPLRLRSGQAPARSAARNPVPSEGDRATAAKSVAPATGSLAALHPSGFSPARDDNAFAAFGEISPWEVEGHLLTSEAELTISVDDYTYRLSTRSFFQVNRHLLGTMLRLVAGHADRCGHRNLAIDLYSGVGFFTAPLAERFDRVIAVEGSPESARYARMNASENVEIVEAAVELQPDAMPDADFIFLDPPRAGARKEVVAAAGQKALEMISYLSCDPVTFSRDANRLTASGWRLSSLDLLDLFPNTHHVETLASFERAG